MTSEKKVGKEIDRILTLIRNKIREKGFTQLEVQESLSWGRSYISQLLTKQKSLRVEQVLLILETIGVDPAEFYCELYHIESVESGLRNLDDYLDGQRRDGLANGVAESAADGRPVGHEDLRTMLRSVVRLLIEKNVINADELNHAVRQDDGGPLMEEREEKPN